MKVKKLKSGKVIIEITDNEIVNFICKCYIGLGFYLLNKYLNEGKIKCISNP